MFSYAEILGCWLKGLRNGNWRRLRVMDKIFYRAAMWYAKAKTKIINNRLIAQLRGIAEKLRTTIRNKIMNSGIERVKEILTRYQGKGVFDWAPKLKTWLKDQKYVFWLGLNSQPPHSNWII